MAMTISGGSSVPTRPQRPDPATLANNIFAKIDTKNQGYIDKAALQSAIDASSDSSKTSKTSNANSVDALFKKLDGDGDGKITKSELTDGFKKLETAFDSSANQSRLQGGGKPGQGAPAGPPPGARDGDGDASKGGGVNSSSATSSVSSKVYDKADTNQDGAVSISEQQAYAQSMADAQAAAAGQSASQNPAGASASATVAQPGSTLTLTSASASGSTSASELVPDNPSSSVSGANDEKKSNRALMKIMSQLMRAYGVTNQNSPSSNATISATA